MKVPDPDQPQSCSGSWPADFVRAGGDVVCEECGKKYIDHPMYKGEDGLDWEGRPFLNQLCDGKLVKL